MPILDRNRSVIVADGSPASVRLSSVMLRATLSVCATARPPSSPSMAALTTTNFSSDGDAPRSTMRVNCSRRCESASVST